MEPNEPQILITLVDELEHLPHVMSIVEQYSWYALDLEGVALGRNGHITMLQLAIDSKHVYCFDMLKLGDRKFGFLKPILEDGCRYKLCYDARCDADALYHRHGITLRGVVDMQVLYTMVHQHPSDPFLKGLCHTLTHAGIVEPQFLDGVLACKLECKNKMKLHGSRLFTNRPLTLQVLQYCVLDVVYLFAMCRQWAPRCACFESVLYISQARSMLYVGLSPKVLKSCVMSMVDFRIPSH